MADKVDRGVRWVIVRNGTRRIDCAYAMRGRIRWAGDYWQSANGWGPIETARYFTTAERETVGDPFGTKWVRVFVNVDPVEAAD